jgi:hypothetical protein
MLSPQTNPYAAPQPVADFGEDERQAALRKVRGPSMGLLVLAISWALLGGVGMLVMLATMVLVLQIDWSDKSRLPGDGPTLMECATLVLSGAAAGFIAYGAWSMRRGRRYRISVAAAILACIPVISPWMYVGIPFGIWALLVLRKPDVRAAFKRN